MSSDVYERLAAKLDELPSGFPSTESGVELKILQKIFTPEEAELTLQMSPEPETIEVIAERFGEPEPEMQAILDDMMRKGHIGSAVIAGQWMYKMIPFVIGIYEYQLNRIDKELAVLFEEYLPTFAREVGSIKPALMRVVPVKKQIKAELSVPRYDDLRSMVNEAKSFLLLECICRKERALEGHRCTHSLETCLGFASEEGAFDGYPRGRGISKEQAIEVLNGAEEAGLVQSAYNIQEGHHNHVCLCCSCCCGLLRGLKGFKAPYLVGKGSFRASINQDTCSACGVCAEERCPMEAIVETDSGYEVLTERCIGCGVCTPTCPTDSITLIQRPEAGLDTPPVNMKEWSKERTANRRKRKVI